MGITPIELKKFIQSNHMVSLYQICTHFHTSIEETKPIIALWVQKNKIKKIKSDASLCHRCVLCAPNMLEFYEWITP